MPGLSQLGQDLRHAARTFWRQPAFASATVLTLALGIGATTAIFSVVYGVLLKPLPFDEPERLVSLRQRAPYGAGTNQGPATYLTYRENQGAFEAIQPFNKLQHFTNFVVAHAHLALLGAFTILGMGVIDYIVAQVWARPLWSRTLTEWQYWLVTVGFTGFFSVLTLAGFQQGFSWADGIPEVNVLPQLHAYYIARGIFGAMIVLSGIVQIVNIGMTVFTNTAERRRRETLNVAEAIAPPPVAG